MLNIFAETFRIATRTERPWLRDAFISEPRNRQHKPEDRFFWQGRSWREDRH